MKCSKIAENKNPKVRETKKVNIIVSLNCAVSVSKKLRFIKAQEASWLLNNLGIRTPLGQLSFLGSILFERYEGIKLIK